MTDFEQAQHQVIDGLIALAEAGGYMERASIQRALTDLHDYIFSMSLEEVYLKSRELLIKLNEEMGITDEDL